MSFSGSLLLLGLLFLRPWLQNRISRQWQYYAWLVVIARLLLPVTPGISLAGNLFQWAGQAVTPSPSYAGAEQCPIPHMLRNSKPRGDELELMQDGNISVSVMLLAVQGFPGRAMSPAVSHFRRKTIILGMPNFCRVARSLVPAFSRGQYYGFFGCPGWGEFWCCWYGKSRLTRVL